MAFFNSQILSSPLFTSNTPYSLSSPTSFSKRNPSERSRTLLFFFIFFFLFSFNKEEGNEEIEEFSLHLLFREIQEKRSKLNPTSLPIPFSISSKKKMRQKREKETPESLENRFEGKTKEEERVWRTAL